MKVTRTTFTTIVKIIALIVALVPFSTYGQTIHSNNLQLGLFYPISTNGLGAPRDTNAISVNLIAGISAQETAFTFAGLTNVVKNNASGVQFAGFSNHIGGNSEGVMFGGFANTYEGGRGLQFAGFSNVARQNVFGGQFAGFLNRAYDVSGFQFAGFSNLASVVEGSQFSGFANSARSITGSQFAGFINTSAKQSRGSQFAGFMNRAGDVQGSQFAGFINIARKVKGTQIAGFINVADSSDNPIGIINIIKNGEKSLGVSTDDQSTTLLSFRSGGRNLYGILGAGYNFNRVDLNLFALEAGLGAHLRLTNSFRINTELAAVGLHDFDGSQYFKSYARVLPALKLGKALEIYGGPAFNWIHTNTLSGKNLTRNYLNEWGDDNYFRAIYIGYTGGVHFLF